VVAGMGLLDSIGAEILPPIAEGQVGGDDTGASLKALREQVERAARALKRYESRLVHNYNSYWRQVGVRSSRASIRVEGVSWHLGGIPRSIRTQTPKVSSREVS
jgi:hypothetical protein